MHNRINSHFGETRPAAHSIFKNPREIDAYGGECGGAGAADGAGIGTCRRGTEPNRATEYKATTRAERAQSLRVPAKIGSYIIVQPHQESRGVRFSQIFFGSRQRKPLISGSAARFARLKCEVEKYEAEDFLEGGLFGGEVEHEYQHLPRPPVRVLKTFADLVDRQTPQFLT